MCSKLNSLLLLAGLIWPWCAQAANVLPPDVARFVARRDLCDHFRGEEPYDAERRQFLEAQTRKLCTGSDRNLQALKVKYSARPPVLSRLNEYEPVIEAGSK